MRTILPTPVCWLERSGSSHSSDEITFSSEVRAAVANTDDPDMPTNTLRVWVIGIIWAIVVPGLNQFFFFRYPSVTITGLVPQLLSFPMGRAWSVRSLEQSG